MKSSFLDFNDLLKDWRQVVVACMASLTAVVGFFAVWALIKNFKLKLSKPED